MSPAPSTATWAGSFAAFATAFDRSDPLDFNEDFLYRIYKKKIPTEAALESLIGFSFRISSSNMIFTSDVMSGYGLLVPPGTQLKQTTPLVDYLAASLRISFLDYYNQLFLPVLSRPEPCPDLRAAATRR